MELSFTQLKQIAEIQDMRDTVEALTDQPEFLTISDFSDIQAINQGGCASGAYMPAVTYHTAIEEMRDHGDEVLQYIEDNLGELPKPRDGESWSGMAVFYLSYAVELWAAQFIELSTVDWD